MNYLIDIGNTSCKTAEVGKDGLLTKLNRYKKVEDLIRSIPSNVDKIVLSNVAADNIELIEKLKSSCNKLIIITVDYINELIQKHPDNKCLGILRGMPVGMGADRIAAILAAHYRFIDEDLIVFDFGTAITVEFINKAKEGKEAEYLGGSISLGLMTRYRAISSFTQRIELCNPVLFMDKSISCIGTNLDEALAAGNILGIKFEIEGYIRENKNRIVIFTGGDSVYFVNRVSEPVFYIENLVLEGMALISNYDE